MNWTQVTAAHDQPLQRCVEILRATSTPMRIQALDTLVAQWRSSLARGTTTLFLGEEAESACFLRFDQRALSGRYFVCFGAAGTAAPPDILAALLAQGRAFLQERGLAEIYAREPKGGISPLVRQIYQQGAVSPQIVATPWHEMSDAVVWRLQPAAA